MVLTTSERHLHHPIGIRDEIVAMIHVFDLTQSTRANWNLRCERDAEWNLNMSKIILDICKSPLYIVMHVRVCGRREGKGSLDWAGLMSVSVGELGGG